MKMDKKTGNISMITEFRTLVIVGMVILLVLAGAINVVAAPTIVTNFSIPSSSADNPFLNVIFDDMIDVLLPMAIICAASLLCTAVWLLVIVAYLWSRSGSKT